jgi:hypothetical protein
MFCYLEEDYKTLEYLKLYFQENTNLLSIDNKIQVKEIQQHLQTHCNYKKDYEIDNWIKENGKKFRDYLNTIKLIYFSCKILDLKFEDLTWEKFCNLERKVNSCKENILDKIF